MENDKNCKGQCGICDESCKKETDKPISKCVVCHMFPQLKGTNQCESCYSVVSFYLENDPKFKNSLLPDTRK